MREEEITRTFIPASPNWCVALYLGDSGEFSLHEILAWEVERSECDFHPSAKRHPDDRHVSVYVTPVAYGVDLHTIGNLWAVRGPNGHFEFDGDCTCATEAEAIEHCRELSDRERAQRGRA